MDGVRAECWLLKQAGSEGNLALGRENTRSGRSDLFRALGQLDLQFSDRSAERF